MVGEEGKGREGGKKRHVFVNLLIFLNKYPEVFFFWREGGGGGKGLIFLCI